MVADNRILPIDDTQHAHVVELAYTLVLEASARKGLEVRLLSGAPIFGKSLHTVVHRGERVQPNITQVWRNGLRTRLKSGRQKCHAGSNPVACTMKGYSRCRLCKNWYSFAVLTWVRHKDWLHKDVICKWCRFEMYLKEVMRE